ncbi:MAG TPA: MarR family transcriptional regulator [Candidatus Bathyarchaeia archaeon]|nr:MarR family transcriptional regulator [Candidatus Bathyarchaeia archaeon]
MRYVRTADTVLGVPPAQLSALSVIVFGGDKSLSELAQTEQVTAPTMSRIVDGLVKQGLVRREVDKEDRRSIIISATEKGRKIMLQGRSNREKQLLQLVEPLAKKEVEVLEHASSILSKRLEELAKR